MNLTQETWSGNTRTYQYDALNQLRSVRHNGTLVDFLATDRSIGRESRRSVAEATSQPSTPD